ncbi:MAG: hypothetical protein AMXMBFR13_15090 [Phycisphaerae bacterium]
MKYSCAFSLIGRSTCIALILVVLLPGCAAPQLPRCEPCATRAAAPEPTTLTIAAVSIDPKLGDVPHNLARIEHWSRKAAAAGAEVILFPEAALTAWWMNRDGLRKAGEPIDGPSIQKLIRLAGELDVTLCVGMTELEGDKAYITHAVIEGTGVIGKHRKSSLAPGEEKWWDEGSDANVFSIRGARVGIAICYESVHPPTCAALKANGAEIILAPYANGTEPVELTTGRRPYTYARAKENGVWYIACDVAGARGDGTLRTGAVYAIDPQGRLVGLTDGSAVGENMLLQRVALPVRGESAQESVKSGSSASIAKRPDSP